MDVVIVGYGPVGQYLSFKLGRCGWTSACIERFPQAYAFPRAVHFDDEIARLFQSIGLDPETNPAIQPFDEPYRWVNADKEILLELELARLRAVRAGTPTTSSTSPTSSGRSTRSSPRSRGPRCSAAGRRSTSSRTTTAPPCSPGRTRPARTPRRGPSGGRYVVGADGANSFVRSRMDVTTTDLGFEFDWLIVDMLLHEPLDRRAAGLAVVPARAADHGHARRGPAPAAVGVHAAARRDDRGAEHPRRRRGAWSASSGSPRTNATLERHVVYTFRARWCRPVARRAAAPRGRRRAPDAAVLRPGHVRRPPRRREPGVEARRRPRRHGAATPCSTPTARSASGTSGTSSSSAWASAGSSA